MALTTASLTQKIITEMHSLGFVTDGPYAKSADLAQAIASAVVAEVAQNAQVIISSGSSAGIYKVT